MAYQPKYRLEWRTPVESNRLDIELDGYSGSVTTLAPGSANPLTIEWGEQDRPEIYLPLMVSTATLRVRGDAKGQLLTEIFGAGDTTYRVRHYTDPAGGTSFSLSWTGYLATDLWEDDPNTESETLTLEALDGLGLLERRAADPNAGSPQQAIRETLNDLGLGLDLLYHMEWYPYVDGGPQIDSNPLARMTFAEPEWSDRRAQLEDVLERFLMQLVQSGGEWKAYQRHFLAGDGTLSDTHVKKPDGDDRLLDNGGVDWSASLPLRENERTRPRAFNERAVEVRSTYSFGRLSNFIQNSGFESGIDPWVTSSPGSSEASVKGYADTPLDRQETQDNASVAFVSSPVDGSDAGQIKQEIPVRILDLGATGAYRFEWEMAADATILPVRHPWIQLVGTGADGDQYYLKSRTLTVTADAQQADDGILNVETVPGSGMTVPEGARLPITDPSAPNDQVQKTYITLSERAEAGDTELKGQIAGSVTAGWKVTIWEWNRSEDARQNPSTGATTGYALEEQEDFPQYPFDSGGDAYLQEQVIQLPSRHPDGTAVTGPFTLRYAVQTVDNDRFGMYVDNVSLNAEIEGQDISQTQYTAAVSEPLQGRSVELEHQVGTGPTATAPSRIRKIFDDQLLTDWQVGPYQSGDSPSDVPLEQLTAETALRYQRQPLKRYTHTLLLQGGDDPLPHKVYTVEGDLCTVTYLRRSYGKRSSDGHVTAEVELTQLKDFGTSGLARSFEMSGDTSGSSDPSSSGSGSSTAIYPGGVADSVEWADVDNKPGIVNTFEGRSGDVSLQPSDIEEVLAGSTVTGNFTVNGLLTATDLKADNSFVLPIGSGSGSGGDGGTTTGSGLTVNTVDGNGNVNSQYTASATALNFGSSFDLTATQNAVEVRLKDQDIGITGDSGSVLVYNGTSWQAQGQSTIVAGDALAIEGKSLSQIGFSDLAASKYTDAEAVSAVETHGNALVINITGDAGSVQGADLGQIRSGVTKSNVGLSNVQNVDQTNASNLTSGTIPEGRFPTDFTLDTVSVKDLTVTGTFFKANVQTVEIEDNLATINKGETGDGVSAGFAGWEVDRGNLTNYFFGFDEGRDRFVVGQGTSDRDVVATREDSPNTDAIPFWNGTENRYDTRSDFTMDGGTLNASSAVIGDLDATNSFTLPIGTAGTGGSGDGTSTGSGLTVNEVDANGNIVAQLTASATALNVRGGATLTADQNAVTIDIDGGGINVDGTSGDVAYHNGSDWQALDQTSLIVGDSQKLEGQSLSAVRSGVTKSDVGLSNVENKALSNAGFSDLAASRYTDSEARSAVDGSDVKPQTVLLEPNTRVSHYDADGALYRHAGQVYLTVDDNFYIRDQGGGTPFHFDTDSGDFKASGDVQLGKKIGMGNDGDVINYLDSNNQSSVYWGGEDGIEFRGDGSVGGIVARAGHLEATGHAVINGKLYAGGYRFESFPGLGGSDGAGGVYTGGYREYIGLIRLTGANDKEWIVGEVSGARSSFDKGGSVRFYAENDPYNDGLDESGTSAYVRSEEGGGAARLVEFEANGYTWVGIEYVAGGSGTSQDVKIKYRTISDSGADSSYPAVFGPSEVSNERQYSGSPAQVTEEFGTKDLHGRLRVKGDHGRAFIDDAISGNTDPALHMRRDNWNGGDYMMLRAAGGTGSEKFNIDWYSGGSITPLWRFKKSGELESLSGGIDLRSNGDLNSVNNLNVSSINSNNGDDAISWEQPVKFRMYGGVAEPAPILLQPDTSGGETAIRFQSNVNSGSDFGEIRWHDHDTRYGTSGSDESSLLEIRTENDDPGGGIGDNIALRPAADLHLDPQASEGVVAVESYMSINKTDPETALHVQDDGIVSYAGDLTASGNDQSTDWNQAAQLKLEGGNNSLAFSVPTNTNHRKSVIQSGHASTGYSNFVGELLLNPLGGDVGVNKTSTNYTLDVGGSFSADTIVLPVK